MYIYSIPYYQALIYQLCQSPIENAIINSDYTSQAATVDHLPIICLQGGKISLLLLTLIYYTKY